MNKIIYRINEALRKEKFAVIQIYGTPGTGKTVLANEILSKFPDYEIRRLHDLRPLQAYYYTNTIEIIEDIHHIWNYQSPLQVKINISKFYEKPKLYSNLIRILVTARMIDLESQFTAYRHYKDSIIDITTGYFQDELEFIPYDIKRKFQKKFINVFRRKLKTRPYIIITKPIVIGRYKKHE